MISLKEIADTLSEVLNSENNPLRIENERVAFLVATEGYRIDKIDDRKLGKNLIPVFVGASGGENQPIPNLSQQSKSINIGIHYPIKYKDIFYQLETYLDDEFVGKVRNMGTETKQCLINLSTAQFGEIVQGNFEQFAKWANNTYERTVDDTQNWYSMILTLYATKLGDGYIFGNEINYALEMTYFIPNISIVVNSNTYTRYSDEDKTISNVVYYAYRRTIFGGYEYIYITTDATSSNGIAELLSTKNKIPTYSYSTNEMVEQDYKVQNCVFSKSASESTEEVDIVRSDAGTGANISPIAEQRIGVDSYAKNVPNITNFNKSMVVYPKLTQDFWLLYITFYNRQILDYIKEMTLIKKYSNGFEYDYKQIVLQANESSNLGAPYIFTLTMGDSK